MTKLAEIRRINLCTLRDQEDIGTIRNLARATGKNEAQLSQYLSEVINRNVGTRVAREIEKKLKLKDGWMDIDHTALPFTPDQITLEKAVIAVDKTLDKLGFNIGGKERAKLYVAFYGLFTDKDSVTPETMVQLVDALAGHLVD